MCQASTGRSWLGVIVVGLGIGSLGSRVDYKFCIGTLRKEFGELWIYSFNFCFEVD